MYSTDTITQLAFHQDQPHCLLSASTDGLVSIFDLSVEDEEDALQQVLNPRSAVHCAGFVDTEHAFVVTSDEQFSIYSLRDDDDATERNGTHFGDVRESLKCTYVVNLIPGAQPVLTCGNNVSGTLSIVQLCGSSSYKFGSVIDLPGAHGEEIVRDVIVLEQERKAISCGEDSQVKIWDLSAAALRSS